MGIQYVNGRLVRMTDEEIQAAIDAATGSGADTKIPKGTRETLTPEQAKSRAAFEANAKKEGEARKLAEANRVKAQTAWAKKDADGDGIPNGTDKTNNSPPAGGSQNGNTNMAKNSTPVKDYINQQLRAAGLPDTPANRSMLRKEYMEIQETQKADTIKADAATAKATQDETDNQAAYDAIMASIGGYQSSADTAKTNALNSIAGIYNPQSAALDAQKQEQLNFLQKVLGQAGSDINDSEKNFLANLRNPTAYNDVPLINMPQQQNALMAALQSQGADTGQVAAQSASDASMNNFMQQLLSRSNQQYGNAQTNYVDALRNAGMGAAKSGRDYLALEQPRLQSGINTKYSDLAAQLAADRAKAEADTQTAYEKAMADAAALKVDAGTKYPQKPKPSGTGLSMTEEEKNRLAAALANFGNFGTGF